MIGLVMWVTGGLGLAGLFLYVSGLFDRRHLIPAQPAQDTVEGQR